MKETIKSAYRIVYNDIVRNGPPMFMGCYDSKNGSVHFMNGIATVMEFIAGNISEAMLEEYENIQFANFEKSLKKGLINK